MTHAVGFRGKPEPESGRTGVWCLVDLPLPAGDIVRNQVIVDMLHALPENGLLDWGYEDALDVSPKQRASDFGTTNEGGNINGGNPY